MQYTPEIKTVRIMCTGRVDPATVAGAFKKGLDGIMVIGCHFGDCHYITGNVQAKLKMDMTRRLFQHIGVNEDRLAFRQCSSGEAAVFVELVSTFNERIRTLGPIGDGGDVLKAPRIFKKLEAAEAVLAGEKMRWVIGKKSEFMESGNKYGEIFTEHEFDRAIDMVIVEEFETQEILGKLKEGAHSVKGLAETLAIPSQRVFRYVTALNRREMIQLEKIDGRTPLYQLAT
ncbi:MAG: hydrogenase iron-sulfur subunit [Deltaproteobacteria bacterium]|nr:hydrogenase iron-sulfur subunit [Deltaproteobacteria bacterium]